MLGLLLSPRLMRWGAWACVLLITILSLLPREMQIRTGALPSLEHAFAYACTAAAFALGFRQKSWWRIAIALGAYSGLMELLQFLSPGRHPGFDGAAGSTLGAFFGAYFARRLLARPCGRRRMTPSGEAETARGRRAGPMSEVSGPTAGR